MSEIVTVIPPTPPTTVTVNPPGLLLGNVIVNPPGSTSTVPGPTGPTGAGGATGPTGAAGAASTVAGPTGPTGAATNTVFASQQIFSGASMTGTYTTPASIKTIRVRMVGGGGGGAGVSGASSSSNFGGGGGNGGAYLEKVIIGPTGTYAYTIGAAGSGGTGAASGTGQNGGDTLFGTLTAKGGGGGPYTSAGTDVLWSAPTGALATTSGGDVMRSHWAGGYSCRNSATLGKSGEGGHSVWGHGGLARCNTTGTGITATGFGAGGGGACTTGTTIFAGGHGVLGYIIVEEYL